ncbi:O-antigen ligase family protein [Acetoanaerobium noterae]|uniref:O-antigen ligase family protein n=1 Tax=Acetoanaerobium noterae TaxID=745369 RepID=UPI0028A93425|nr:O-antigen ligase family protein [Acetoanaerobium noterae]
MIKNESRKKSNNDENKFDLLRISPLLLIIAILPFVINLKLIPLQHSFYEFWKGEKINADFFTYYKQIFIYIVTILALLNTFLFTKKIKFTKAYYFMGFYAALVLLSTVFSKYPQIALNGFVERREGMWVVICYILIMFSTINLVETEKQLRIILYTLGISGALISIISIFQYFGMDIFTTEFAKNFMISKEIQAQIKEFNINFGEKYSYGVFYNPNYLGGYISLYAPLMLSFAVISKDIKEKVIFSLSFILSIVALYGSRSEAGVLGTAGAIGLLIILLTVRYIIKDKSKDEYKKILITRLAPLCLVLILLPVSLSYVPISENPLAKLRTEAFSVLTPTVTKNVNYKEIGPINDIKQLDTNTIEMIITNKSTYVQIKDNSTLSILDNNKNAIWEQNMSTLDNSTNVNLESINDYKASLTINKSTNEDTYGLKYNISTYGTNLNFLVENEKLFLADRKYKKLDIERDLKVAEYIGFEGKGKLGSNRGYLWSRSLPIMLNNIIIGTGQDTFITEFPQNDIYARQVETFGWEPGILIDKPHNTFIQIGIHSGLISLIVILIGLILLITKSAKNILHNNVNYEYSLVIVALFGFLLSSIFNDSILAITPIAYIFLGIAVKGILKSEDK